MTDFGKVNNGYSSPLNTGNINPDASKQNAKKSSADSAVSDTPQAAPTRTPLDPNQVLGHFAQQAKTAALGQVIAPRVGQSVATFEAAWSPEQHEALVSQVSTMLEKEFGVLPSAPHFNKLVEMSVERYLDKNVVGTPAIA
ncbi:MAG: hypothetical protein VKJ06_07590 [Vampirovibrionales bacterium]|nr:hypothetical protein [Vampirovibrionales bacterium]